MGRSHCILVKAISNSNTILSNLLLRIVFISLLCTMIGFTNINAQKKSLMIDLHYNGIILLPKYGPRSSINIPTKFMYSMTSNCELSLSYKLKHNLYTGLSIGFQQFWIGYENVSTLGGASLGYAGPEGIGTLLTYGTTLTKDFNLTKKVKFTIDGTLNMATPYYLDEYKDTSNTYYWLTPNYNSIWHLSLPPKIIEKRIILGKINTRVKYKVRKDINFNFGIGLQLGGKYFTTDSTMLYDPITNQKQIYFANINGDAFIFTFGFNYYIGRKNNE
jgi:hypothetical protein